MKTLLDVCKFLKAAGTYYLATVDCDKPRVRPFGTAHIYNGKLYIQTGKKKAVSHQICLLYTSCIDRINNVQVV